MIRCAREVATGRVALARTAAAPMAPVTAYADVVAALRAEPDFARLLAIREIGPWTVECSRCTGSGGSTSSPPATWAT